MWPFLFSLWHGSSAKVFDDKHNHSTYGEKLFSLKLCMWRSQTHSFFKITIQKRRKVWHKSYIFVFYSQRAESPWTRSPSHHVKMFLFPLVTFFMKPLTGLLITSSSFPPRFSQLSLAWDQGFDSSTNSKQTFLKTKSHAAGKPLPRQGSDLSGKDRDPAKIHKSTKVRGNMSDSVVIRIGTQWCSTRGRNSNWAGPRPTVTWKWESFLQKHSAYVLNTLGKSLQTLKQDAKWRTIFISVQVTQHEFMWYWPVYTLLLIN